MLGNATVIAFAATIQPERALAFYRDRLGLTLIEESPYALLFQAGSTMLRVQIVEAFVPQRFTMLGWDVPDIRTTVHELAANGVAVERYSFLDLDGDGIWWTPNGDGVAWFNDPDGNTLSLTQFASG